MSFPLPLFHWLMFVKWVNFSEPYDGEKVTYISKEEIGKRKKMDKK